MEINIISITIRHKTSSHPREAPRLINLFFFSVVEKTPSSLACPNDNSRILTLISFNMQIQAASGRVAHSRPSTRRKKIKFRSTSVETPSFFSHLSSCGIYISPIKCLAVAPFAKRKKRRFFCPSNLPTKKLALLFRWGQYEGPEASQKSQRSFLKQETWGSLVSSTKTFVLKLVPRTQVTLNLCTSIN